MANMTPHDCASRVTLACSLIGCCCLQGDDMGGTLLCYISAALRLQGMHGLRCRAVIVLLISSVLIAIPAWYSRRSSQLAKKYDMPGLLNEQADA